MDIHFSYVSGAEKTSEDIALSDGKAGKAAQLKQKKKKRHGYYFQKFNLTPFIVWYSNSLYGNYSYSGNGWGLISHER